MQQPINLISLQLLDYIKATASKTAYTNQPGVGLLTSNYARVFPIDTFTH